MTPGSTLIHDMEGAHMTLVNKLSLKSQRYNAKLLKCVPDGQNPLGLVNRKVAMVLDRAMRYPKTLRFRQFYARRPSSDEFDE